MRIWRIDFNLIQILIIFGSQPNNFMAVKQCLIYCRCGGENVSESLHGQLTSLIKKFNTDVIELHDLCAYSVNEKEVLKSISEKYHKKTIIACYPRAVKHMLIQGGIDIGNYNFISFKELNPEQIEKMLKNELTLPEGMADYQIFKNSLDVPAWFPVIDHTRCTYCGKCSKFCLFGVYKFSKGSLEVVNPLSCKNFCPACGRTCPANAIMFPRLAEKSVLAGAEPGEIKINIEEQSLFNQLNERNRNRKSIFRQGVVQLAEEERKKALAEFKKMQFKKE